MRLHPQDRVEAYTAAGWWGHPTWPSLLAGHASERPDALAVADPPNKPALTDAPVRRLTWAELAEYVDGLAGALAAEGVTPGDVVAIQLPNSVELSAAYLACATVGAIATPFPVQFREYELAMLGKLANVAAAITADRIGEHQAARRMAEAGIARVLSVDSVRLRPYQGTHLADPNDAVTICWTSGTEATPKGVPRCADDWYVMGLASVDAAALSVDDVLLNPFPMVNMAGIGGMLVPWLITGAPLIQHHPFDPPTFFGQLAAERITYTVAPPALLTMVLAQDLPAAALSSLRVVGSGAAPLQPHMIAEWKRRYGIDIINCFGSNEGTSLAGDPVTVPDPERRAVLFPRFGSADHQWPNRASHGMRSRLVDVATGEEITETGRAGELRISGPGVFAGYLAGTFDSDPFDDLGYFRTGDLFTYVADESGDPRYLRYVDRAKDIIVRGGMNISPAEIEALVSGHPKITEASVIGYPDPVLGEKACVVAVTTGELTLEDVLEYLRDKRIASYKLPERLVVVPALPRNAIGKVLKRSLREELIT